MVQPAVPPSRVHPPMVAGEKASLLGYLDFHRATVRRKCAGLTPEQLLARSAPPSTLCLLGLVRHLADCEYGWFRETFNGEPRWALYSTEDDPRADLEIHAADEASVAATWIVFEEQVDAVNAILAAHDLDELSQRSTPSGHRPSLRWIVLHLIEEYARHNGHADLLREAIDGSTGE